MDPGSARPGRTIGTPRSSVTLTLGPEGPGDAPPNHADNRAFRGTVELKGEALCRAAQENERVDLLLRPFGSTVEVTETDVRATLVHGGYQDSSVEVRSAGRGALHVGVFRQGVCIEAFVSPESVTTEPHGVYLEGGCLEPRGGH